MSARTRKDWILWGALGCALVSTAHAEYTLATASHFNKYVALAVPGALDLYVIRALQQRRDVLVAVLAMVAANVTSHLIAGGVLPVTWHVIAAVGAVAPLIVWRVYSLKYTRTRQELLWGLDAGTGPEDTSAVSALDEYTCECSWWVKLWRWLRRTPDECAVPEAHPAEDDPSTDALVWGPLMKWGPLEASAPVPDHVPGEWSASAPPSTDAPVPYLRPVPDLPAEYAASAVHSDVLKESDMPYLAGAQQYVDDVADPTVRGLKTALRIGQERAERLLAHLGVRP